MRLVVLYAALLALFVPLTTLAQGVGIGTAAPAASAALEVKSTTGGLLLPRMTVAEREAIPSPTNGLLVFQTDGTPGLYYYIGPGWLNLSNGLVPDAGGNAGGGSPAVRVSTLAGGGTVTVYQPSGVACDGTGNVFVAEPIYNSVWKIVAATGVVTTLAGSGTAGYADGTGTAAQFNVPISVACDGSGNLYVADYGNNRIRRIVAATGAVSTLAGNGTAGFGDGRTLAQFNRPTSVACDGNGNVYVADRNNQRVRRIVVATGVVSTMAGSATGTAGYANGTGAAAQFNLPYGVAYDGSSSTVYVADYGNNRIRVIK